MFHNKISGVFITYGSPTEAQWGGNVFDHFAIESQWRVGQTLFYPTVNVF